MKNKILFAVTSIVLALFTSCSDNDSSRYSHYPASFSFNSSIHPYYIATNPGEFITITRSGATAYKVEWAKGELTVQLSQQDIMLGGPYYGLGGLIIGIPAAGDGNIIACDLACPHCERAEKKLTIIHSHGHAHCNKCGSTFDLNSGGIPIEGPAQRTLWQYRVFRSETNPIINITN